MNVIEESRQKRPIAMAGLRLTMLCDHPDKRTDDEYWALAKVLLGKKNVNTWLEDGEAHAREMIRKMLYRNLDMFRYADTTGEGLVKRLYRMFLDGDFVDDTGNDVLIANIMGKDKGDAFTKVLLNKIGVSPEVLLICINAYAKNRKEVG